MGAQVGRYRFDGFLATHPHFLEQRQAFRKILSRAKFTLPCTKRGFCGDPAACSSHRLDLVSEAIAKCRRFRNTVFPRCSQLGQQLQTVSRLIDVRADLQMDRQIFLVAAGGFDFP